MPLPNHQSPNPAKDDEASTSTATSRIAIRISILRGAKQTNILPRTPAKSRVLDRISRHTSEKPGSQTLPTTSQCRLEAPLAPHLLEVQEAGTAQTLETATPASQEQIPWRDHLSDHKLDSGPINPTLVEGDRHHFCPASSSEMSPHRSKHRSRHRSTYLSSELSSYLSSQLSTTRCLTERLFAAVDGATSDVLRRPSRPDRKWRSENGVSVGPLTSKDALRATPPVLKVRNSFDRVGEAQRLLTGTISIGERVI